MIKKYILLSLISLAFLLYPTISQQKNYTGVGYAIKKIVIDAGHGGKDHGCSGKNSKEKHITLGIAIQLSNMIKKSMPNVKIVFTRDKDVFVPLHKRARIANKQKADLFISIHCNSSPKHKSAYGTETYVMGIDKSAQNLAVARRENSVILMEDNYEKHYDGYDLNRPDSHIVFSLYQNAYLNQSIHFADLVEKQFKRKKRKSRGVKQQSFLVLYKTAMPSVLIEAGFLSNPKEEGILTKWGGRNQTAQSIFDAFKRYKRDLEGATGMYKRLSLDQEVENLAQQNQDGSCQN